MTLDGFRRMITVRMDVDDAALRDAFLRTSFLEALAALRADQPPRWGRMSAQQMVEHLSWTFAGSNGRVQIECPTPEGQWASMKAFLHSNRPAPPGFMNPVLAEGLPALQHPSVPAALAALKLELELFLAQERAHPDATHMHPLFGPLDLEEWSRTHFKHCVHHLLQFGLIEVEWAPARPRA